MRRAELRVESIDPVIGGVPTAIWMLMMNVQWRLPWGIRHVFVSLLNLAIRWTDRPGRGAALSSDLVYVVVAQRDSQLDLAGTRLSASEAA
jgi:hypothetical protein